MMLCMLAVVLSGIILGSVSIVYPFGRDQGIYAYIGKLILNGKIDYKYSYNLRPPGIHYVFALSQFMMGESMLNMRVFDMCWQVLTACVIFLLAFRTTKSRTASVIAAVLYIFLYYRLDYWHTMQTDGFMNLPFTLTILFFMKACDENSRTKFLFSGCMFAITLLFKFTIILFLPLLVITILTSGSFANMRVKTIAGFFSGFGVILLLVLGYYYLNNAFSEFIDIQFNQIPHYARIGFETESSGFVLSNVVRLFTASVYTPLIAFSVIAYVYLIRKRMMSGDTMLILIWTITCFASLIIQWKFFLYHFLIIIPPLVICTALFVSILVEKFYRKSPKLIGAGFVVVVILFLLISARPYYSSYPDFVSYLRGNAQLKDLYIKYGITSDSVFTIKKTFEAVDFVNGNSKPADKIYIWGIEPLIYYISGHDCASRFTYNTPLYWKGGNEMYRQEFMNEISAGKPHLILVAKRDPMLHITGYNESSEQMLERFPEFKSLMDKKYHHISDVAEFAFYKLNDAN